MRKLFLVAVGALLATMLAAHAVPVVVGDLGNNPTSAQGTLANAPGLGVFDNAWTFTLSGGPQFLTIASVTNTFASASSFIDSFMGSVFDTVDGVVGNGDDVPVLGPFGAVACAVPNCQVFSGFGLLSSPGSYYLSVSGNAESDAGYGGNLSTSAVPGPIAGAGLPGLIAAMVGLVGLARRRRNKIVA